MIPAIHIFYSLLHYFCAGFVERKRIEKKYGKMCIWKFRCLLVRVELVVCRFLHFELLFHWCVDSFPLFFSSWILFSVLFLCRSTSLSNVSISIAHIVPLCAISRRLCVDYSLYAIVISDAFSLITVIFHYFIHFFLSLFIFFVTLFRCVVTLCFLFVLLWSWTIWQLHHNGRKSSTKAYKFHLVTM